MSRIAVLFFACCLGTFSLVGCGRDQSVDKPTEDEQVESGGYESMTEEEQAEYDRQMAEEMGN
jgi:hypothetical protein